VEGIGQGSWFSPGNSPFSINRSFAVGDHDWVRFDQAVAYFNSIPGAELFVVPDAGHFVLRGMSR
jgi:hypothetical protein